MNNNQLILLSNYLATIYTSQLPPLFFSSQLPCYHLLNYHRYLITIFLFFLLSLLSLLLLLFYHHHFFIIIIHHFFMKIYFTYKIFYEKKKRNY